MVSFNDCDYGGADGLVLAPQLARARRGWLSSVSRAWKARACGLIVKMWELDVEVTGTFVGTLKSVNRSRQAL